MLHVAMHYKQALDEHGSIYKIDAQLFCTPDISETFSWICSTYNDPHLNYTEWLLVCAVNSFYTKWTEWREILLLFSGCMLSWLISKIQLSCRQERRREFFEWKITPKICKTAIHVCILISLVQPASLGSTGLRWT